MHVDKAIAGTLPGLFRAHLLLTPGADDYRQCDQHIDIGISRIIMAA